MSDARASHDSSPARRPRLLLVGWDGAVPELLERFVSAGKLPGAQRLFERGSFRPLRSTIPPVTACAWSSFLSGRNPGRHGLFEFVAPRPGSYAFDYTNGGQRRERGSDFLALLNAAGLRVGCVNVPMTYPPRPLDGFVISGLDAPDEKSGIALPKDDWDAAHARIGTPYRIDNRHLGNMRSNDDREAALQEFIRVERLRTDYTLAMIERQPIDVLVTVYNATDQVQHHFWHLMDATHPQYPGDGSEEVRRFRDAIERIYIACDVELARLMDAFPDADVLLISDHGAGGTNGPRVRFNNALGDAGLLTWTAAKGSLVSNFVGWLDAFLRRTLSAKTKALLARLLPSGRSAIEAMSLPPIDWARTTAFAYEGFTLSPSIWINRKSVFPLGTVGDGEEYEQALSRTESALRALRDPRSGRPVIPAMYRARDVYPGRYTHGAPDLILDWWSGQTFTMTRSHPSLAGQPSVFYPDGPAIAGQDITGIHRWDGVLAAAGPTIGRAVGTPQAASLIDLAPTTLALMGLSVPADMDGKVLSDIARGPVRVSAACGASPASADEVAPGYSEEDARRIEERLSGLGYIE